MARAKPSAGYSRQARQVMTDVAKDGRSLDVALAIGQSHKHKTLEVQTGTVDHFFGPFHLVDA